MRSDTSLQVHHFRIIDIPVLCCVHGVVKLLDGMKRCGEGTARKDRDRPENSTNSSNKTSNTGGKAWPNLHTKVTHQI